MTCKKCGTAVCTNDRFCPGCGVSFQESPSSNEQVVNVTYRIVQAQQRNDNGIYGLMNQSLGSPAFLTTCILASLAVFLQLIMFDYSDGRQYLLLFAVFPVIMTVFLWILYHLGVTGKTTMAASPFKALHIIAKIQYVISWVTAVCLLVLGILLLLVESDTGSGKVEIMMKVEELAELVSKILTISVLLGPIYNMILILDIGYLVVFLFDDGWDINDVLPSDSASVGTSVFIIMLVFAVAIVVFNKFFMDKAIESVSAFSYSAEYGKDYYGSAVQTSTWGFVIAGLFIAVAVLADVDIIVICMLLAYAGFLIAMGLVLSRFSKEAWRMEQKRKAHPDAEFKCAECGYSKPYSGQCPSCGSSHKVRF